MFAATTLNIYSRHNNQTTFSEQNIFVGCGLFSITVRRSVKKMLSAEVVCCK